MIVWKIIERIREIKLIYRFFLFLCLVVSLDYTILTLIGVNINSPDFTYLQGGIAFFFGIFTSKIFF